MHKLSQENIRFIDEFSIRHRVKFIDVRIELIDHLASEYETEKQTEKLHAFLMRKRDFIKTFVKERQKKIHWTYQKKLLKEVAMFFYKPKHIVFTLLIGFLLYNIKQLNIEKVTMWTFLISIITPLAVALYKQIRMSSKLKKIQSFQTVASIMSLPSLFLYMFTPFESFMSSVSNLFYFYWFIAIIFGCSGLIIFNRLLKKTISSYNKIMMLN